MKIIAAKNKIKQTNKIACLHAWTAGQILQADFTTRRTINRDQFNFKKQTPQEVLNDVHHGP